jgi:translation initiation factor IF-3
MIRITPIRVIGPTGEQIGVIETSEAIKMAIDQGMDLVEISPETRPPVCKIMDYGKFKYEQSKQTKNKGAKASEMKEVRLGRSVKIGDHDVDIRVKQARGFLVEGHKVLITQKFKGREMAHRELGINRLRDIKDRLADISKCESEPRWMGPQASIILAPDKAKCEAYKRQIEKEKRAAEKAAGRAEKAQAAEEARNDAGVNGLAQTPPADHDAHKASHEDIHDEGHDDLHDDIDDQHDDQHEAGAEGDDTAQVESTDHADDGETKD